MHAVVIIVGIAFIVNMALGISVLKTNPRRLVNQEYFLLTFAIGLWLLSVGFVLQTTVPARAEVGIRLASVFAPLIFTVCHLIRISIREKETGIVHALRVTKWHWLVWFIFCGICSTDFFVHGVVFPDSGTGFSVAEPVYGAGFILMNIYFAVLIVSLLVGLSLDIRRSFGMERLELQYVAMGATAGGAVGGFFAIFLPLIMHSSQTAPLAPLGVLLFGGLMAYGIARSRIMDVSYVLQRSVGAVFLAAFLGLIYFVAWLVFNWILTDTCGLSESVPYFFASIVSMVAFTVLRPLISGWVDQLFFDKKGATVPQVLEEVARDLQSITTMDKLLEQFMALGPSVVGASESAVFIRNKKQYRCEAGNASFGYIPVTDPIILLLSKERTPLILENVERQQQNLSRAGFCAGMRALGYHAAIGIFSPRQLEGVLLLGPREKDLIYSYIELDSLQVLCNQLAVSLENANLYTQVQNAKIYNETLLDQLVTGVVAAAADGRVTFFNREAQRITRQPDLKGKTVSCLPPSLHAYWSQAIEVGKELRDIDVKITVEGESLVPVRLSASPFRSAEGEMLGALLVFNDMTAMTAMEAKIRRADRLMSVGTLAAGMAHEIKNPLVSIKTFSQLLPDRYEDPDFRTTFSELMGQEVGRIDCIVNQLLSFARPPKPKLAPIRVHDVLEKSASLVQEQLKTSGLELVLKLDETRDLIQGDAGLLHQVFVNFYLNAIDAMEDGGQLTIQTRNVGQAVLFEPREVESNWVQIEVSDTGKGICREEQQKIFDPFYTSKSEGTGLGLSVAYNIIQEHGGSIDLSSQVGKGTTFSILLPVSAEQNEA